MYITILHWFTPLHVCIRLEAFRVGTMDSALWNMVACVAAQNVWQ